MLRNLRIAGGVLLVALFLAANSLHAAQMTGQIESISKKASTIQVRDAKTQEVIVFRIGKGTRFENAGSFQEFIVNDKVTVQYEPGQPVTVLERKLVKVPPEQVIDTRELAGLISSGSPMLLVDARPAPRYKEGHLPGAVSLSVSEMEQRFDELPADKNRLWSSIAEAPLEA